MSIALLLISVVFCDKRKVISYLGEKKLTPREQQILILLKEGFTSAKIGQQLCISKNTVDTHRRNILKKLGAKNTIALITRKYF